MPRGEKTTAFQLRFRPALLAELEEIASADGLSVAALMRQLAERHVRSVKLEAAMKDPESIAEYIQRAKAYDEKKGRKT